MDPKRVKLIAIIVVAGVVASGGGIAYYVTHKSSGCHLSSKNPLIFDQPERPDDLDPGVVFTTPGWGIAQQVYQTLVMYNGSSYTSFAGILAKNWSVSPDQMHWNFTLRPGEHFSNGDPLNAYVIWWSLYRNMILASAMLFILEENFYVPNVSYYSNLSAVQASNATLVGILNQFTSAAFVNNPSPDVLSYMEAQNQSFRVIDNLTLQINLGFGYLPAAPYTYLLAQIAAPTYSAVDPLVIEANGGVQAGSRNAWMDGHMLGSGPFTLTSYDYATGYTMTPDPNYWAKNAAAQEPWNPYLQPAKTAIQIRFQGNPTLDAQDLKSGAAAVASFAYIGPSTLAQVVNQPCIVVHANPPVYGAVSAAWWVFMDQNVQPFNNLSVREAVVHAIDYQNLIHTAYNGNATSWVGPVPPGYPNYNPGNLTPYQYNPSLAQQEIDNSPWPLTSGGYSSMTGQTLAFEYVNVGNDPAEAALIIQSDLAKIGISLNLVPLDLNQLATEQAKDPSTGACTSTESANGGPFYIGENYYTADYVSPDDATQLNALSYGSYNLCMSEYANTTMDNTIYQALSTANATLSAQDYANITSLMYNNYTNAWLYVPTAFSVYNSLVQGIVSNPMGSGLPFTMVMNTEYAA